VKAIFSGGLPAWPLGVFGDPCVHRGDADVPRGARRHAARVEAVEVAAGRQAVGIAHRVAAVAGLEVAAVEGGEQAFDFFVVRECGVDLLRAQGHGSQCAFGIRAHRARGIGILERDFDPSCEARSRDVLRIDKEGLIDVFAQRFGQRLAEDLQDRHAATLRIRRLPEGCEAQRLRGLRQFVQVRMQHRDEAGEVGANACGRPFQVAVVVLLDELRGELFFHRGFHRPGRQRLPVVHPLMHRLHAGAKARGREHRCRVAHHRRAAAALGGRGFAEVVHDVRVDVGQVAEREQRIVLHREPTLLARRPFDRAVRAHVHDRARAELRAQPQVRRQVAVAERNGRAVVDLLGLARHLRTGLEARRLAQHDDVAELHARDDEGLLARDGPQHRRFLRRPPVGLDAALRLHRQCAKPRDVARQRQRIGQSLVEQRLQRIAAIDGVVGLHRRLHLRDERVRAGYRGAVARRLHRRQHVVHAARHVEKRRTEVRLARRVVVDQHRDAPVRGRRALQPQQRSRLAGHRVDLRGQRLQRAAGGIARAHEHRVGHAGQFARAVVGGDVGLREAVLALRPTG
jgi:hypothetical protein